MQQDYYMEKGHYMDIDDRITAKKITILLKYQDGKTIDELANEYDRDFISFVLLVYKKK